MRYLMLILLVGCGTKAAADKAKDIDACRLKYPTSKLDLCLTTEHGWSEADAVAAQSRQENTEVR